MTQPLQYLMEKAVDYAYIAGDAVIDGRATLLRERSRPSTAFSIAATANATAENLIIERLDSDFPNDAVLSEEGTTREGTTARRWIIDPIDGTTNLLHGFNEVAISIAVEINGEYEVGVVYNPLRNEMFCAASGIGAFLNDERLSIRLEDIASTRAIVGLSGGNHENTRSIRAEVASNVIMQSGTIRPTGSAALDFCFVAAGRLDAALGVGLSSWDLAAGSVIAKETKCTVEGSMPDTEADSDLAVVSAVGYIDTFRQIVHGARFATGSIASRSVGVRLNTNSGRWNAQKGAW